MARHLVPTERLWALATSPIARVSVWLALIAATGLLVRAEVSRPEQPQGVRLIADLAYRESWGGRRPRLDVYLPASAPPRSGWPVLLAIHGGGWRGGDKGEYGRSLAPLVRRGWAVVAINYQLSRPAAPSWPANLDDVRAARHWIHRHAREFSLNRARIAAIGASAGAHLALLCALDDNSPPICAVIDFYGPADLTTLFQSGTGADRPLALMLGTDQPGFEARVEAASPLRHLRPGLPPVLILHGDDDPLIPVSQSRALAVALQRAGVEQRLTILPGARHGFGLSVGTRDLVPEIVQFLEDCCPRESPVGRSS